MKVNFYAVILSSLTRHVAEQSIGSMFAAIVLFSILNTPLSAQDAVNFGRKIRPLLADKCFACHGLDAKSREGDLRLDIQQGLFGKGESGEVAVVPGDADRSSVYHRLLASGDDKMPPDGSGKSLTSEEIELIKRWINEGAKWQQHWSLLAPVRPTVPKINDSSWPRNEIDRFVLARLKQEHLQPADEADKTTLLRRVTYDLTGLPPTPAEVRAFLADDSVNAYEKVVERLLKSPRYGEHMAKFWLDAARYGDTHGLHLDNYRVMWPYRDWVINAFNNNMPFDQFTIEQLAGDLLPNPTQDQIIATGFNRCNVTTSEGGAISEEYEVYYTNDRVATMSTVWMGISMGCVTCHESKFDPFEMKDFYQLYAFFNNLDGPVMDGNAKDTAPMLRIYTEDQRAESAAMDQQIKVLTQLMTAPREDIDSAQQNWESDYRAMMIAPTNWSVLRPERYSSSRSASFEKLEDDSLLVSGTNASQDVYEVVGTIRGEPVTAVRLEGLTHPSLTDGGTGRSSNSNVVLTEFDIEVAPIPTAGEPTWKQLKINKAWADHEQPNGDFKVLNAIDGKKETGWAINGHQRRENRTAIFGLESPIECEKGTLIRVRLHHESIYAQHQFGRIRLATTSDERIPQLVAGDVPADIAKAIELDASKRDEKQQVAVRDYYRGNVTSNAELKSAREELASTKKQKADLEASLPISLVWKDAAKPKPSHILLRGAYDKPGAEVSRNTPAALPPLTGIEPGTTPTRLDLAKWLLSPEHPLTARVIVNRYWQQLFGVGIVETSEDFGSQGTPPSHPELLDWLAVDFRESGWDVKRIVKAMVMSSTYRQSARMNSSGSDPGARNLLLSRGPRFRMESEMIRDTALAASGLLVTKIGGPSVKPYQPPGIWEAVGYTDSNTANFTRDNGDALYRRSIYTFWKRTAPPPVMVTLDAPSRESCSVRRSRTNTPLASLALMNDIQFIEASRGMAQRMILEGGDQDAARIAYGFLIAVGRYPTKEELEVADDVLQDALARYRKDTDAAVKLISVGDSKADPNVDPKQLAAYTMVANLLLNLDETITK